MERQFRYIDSRILLYNRAMLKHFEGGETQISRDLIPANRFSFVESKVVGVFPTKL